jgi:sulfoxide reductase catalytic subunit YedY
LAEELEGGSKHRRALLHHVTSRQHYTKVDVSPFFRVNGYPPSSPEYQRLADQGFVE